MSARARPRIAAALAIAAIAALAPATAASANADPPEMVIESAEVVAGGELVLTVTGLPASTATRLELVSDGAVLAEATSDADGTVSLDIDLPADVPTGEQEVALVANESVAASTVVLIEEASAQAGGEGTDGDAGTGGSADETDAAGTPGADASDVDDADASAADGSADSGAAWAPIAISIAVIAVLVIVVAIVLVRRRRTTGAQS